MLYKRIIKPIAFKFDAEDVHNRVTKLGQFLGRYKATKKVLKKLYYYENKILEQNILNIKFKNPIGLAAGFDKNAKLLDVLPSVGFGYVEVGSITGEKCEGNPKPRLFRLPKDRALLVNYGLFNDGAEIISKRLQNKKYEIPVGISVARTNIKLTKEEAIKDYYKAFKIMQPFSDYVTVNVSCPNADDGRMFSDKKHLKDLLKEINKIEINKPVFLKLKPDVNKKEIDDVLAVINDYKFIKGLVISNLTKHRENLKTKKEDIDILSLDGSISGKAIWEKSNEMLKYVASKTKGKYIIIGVGGIFNADDAYYKIRNGASLVQLMTGMIYEGPGLIKNINKRLVEKLKKDNFSNIGEAVGVDVKGFKRSFN